MVKLFDSKRTHKSSSFGRGMLASRPHSRLDIDEADRRWWAAQTLATARDFDVEAEYAAAADRLERGLF
jgi:hypothetical protein